MSEELEMRSTRHLLMEYNEHRVCDWDLIIISSIDESQKRAFEQQLDQMKANDRHLISDKFKFLVISDQSFINETNQDCKLGSGGSTLHIFKYICQELGPNYMKSNKMLVCHSGGLSQRLPHYSVLGKLFSNLPIHLKLDNKYWTALDVKLALLAPFARLMPSGVFVTSSDDVVIYSYNDLELKQLPQFGSDCIVALGHPSDVDISVNHGVYVLENQDLDSINSKSVSIHNCLKVLQKPTFDELTQFGAFVTKDDKEFCVTDSSYYLGADVIIDKFMKFPIDCLKTEIDCYGHFLCPLGSDPITKDPKSRFSSPLNDILIGSQFKVLFLSQSKFFHLGTIGEYMQTLTDYKNKELANSLSFKLPTIHNSIKGTVFCSLINEKSVIDMKSVIEFCDFSQICIETENNLLYNCMYDKSTDVSLSVIRFPANYLIYTVAVTIGDCADEQFCTLGCRLNSQLKSSLWFERVFPVCRSSSESLLSTLKLIQNDFNSNLFSNAFKLSMNDIKEVKNIDNIMTFQNKLKSIL